MWRANPTCCAKRRPSYTDCREGRLRTRQRVELASAALLWPALCSTCTLAGFALYAILFRDGLRHSPGLIDSAAWIVVFVPIIVVLCSLIFGGVAVAAGLLVRSVVRLRTTTTSVSRTVLLAAVTGSCIAGVVIGFFALFRQSWAVADAAYGYAAVIGVVAAFASAVYARKLFDESANAPKPDIL
jgi:hypothetical protein